MKQTLKTAILESFTEIGKEVLVRERKRLNLLGENDEIYKSKVSLVSSALGTAMVALCLLQEKDHEEILVYSWELENSIKEASEDFNHSQTIKDLVNHVKQHALGCF